jgi:hypothetical protein
MWTIKNASIIKEASLVVNGEDLLKLNKEQCLNKINKLLVLL